MFVQLGFDVLITFTGMQIRSIVGSQQADRLLLPELKSQGNNRHLPGEPEEIHHRLLAYSGVPTGGMLGKLAEMLQGVRMIVT